MNPHEYINQLKRQLDQLPHDDITRVCAALVKLRKNGGTLYLFGNGGSVSLASHLACDFNKGVILPPPLKTNCLNDHVAEITAYANDTDYDNILRLLSLSIYILFIGHNGVLMN